MAVRSHSERGNMLRELQEHLNDAVNDKSDGRQSKLRLRLWLISLITGATEPKANDHPVLGCRLAKLVLQRLSAVFEASGETTLLAALLLQLPAVLKSPKKPAQDAWYEVVWLTAGLLETYQEGAFSQFYYGLQEWILDVEGAMLQLAMPPLPADDASEPVSVVLFADLFHTAEVHGKQMVADKEMQEHMAREGVTLPTDGMRVLISTVDECTMLAELGVRLLMQLLGDSPCRLAPATAPMLLPSVAQLLMCNSISLQVACLRLMAVLVNTLNSQVSLAEQVLQHTLRVLEGWSQGLLPLGAEQESWQVAILATLDACVLKLLSSTTYPVFAQRVLEVLCAAACKASRGSQFQALLCGMVADTLRDCPSLAPHATKLLPMLPNSPAVLSPVLVCLFALSSWMSAPNVSDVMRQEIEKFNSSHNNSLGTSMGADISMEEEKAIDMDSTPARKRRKLTRFRQTQLTVAGDGTLMTQRVDSDPPPARLRGRKSAALTQGAGNQHAARPTLDPSALQRSGHAADPPASVMLQITQVRPVCTAILSYLAKLSCEPNLGEEECGRRLQALQGFIAGVGKSCPAPLLLVCKSILQSWISSLTGQPESVVSFITTAAAVYNAVVLCQLTGSQPITSGRVAPLLLNMEALVQHVKSSAPMPLPVNLACALACHAALSIPCQQNPAATQLLKDALTQVDSIPGTLVATILKPLVCCLPQLEHKPSSPSSRLAHDPPDQTHPRQPAPPTLAVNGNEAHSVALQECIQDLMQSLPQPSAPSSTQSSAAAVSGIQTAILSFNSSSLKNLLHIIRAACRSAIMLTHANEIAQTGPAEAVYSLTLDPADELLMLALSVGAEGWLRNPSHSLPTVLQLVEDRVWKPESNKMFSFCPSLTDLDPLYRAVLQEPSAKEDSARRELLLGRDTSTSTRVKQVSVSPMVKAGALAVFGLVLDYGADDLLEGSKKVSHKAVQLVQNEDKIVRQAAVQLLPLLLRPCLMKAFWSGEPKEAEYQTTPARQRAYLNQLRTLLRTNEDSSVHLSLLQAAFQLHERLRGKGAEMIALWMLVECCASSDPTVLAAAVELLRAVAASMDETLESLLLHSQHTPDLLQYMGRYAAARGPLFKELSELLGMEEKAFVELMLPHAIGWLCLTGDRVGLTVLAEKMECTVPTLIYNTGGENTIPLGFWSASNAESIRQFIRCLDELLYPEHETITLVEVCWKHSVYKVVWMAGLDVEWECAIAVPDHILSNTRKVLTNIAVFVPSVPDDCTDDDAIAYILAGEVTIRLLKSIGEKVGMRRQVGKRNKKDEAECIHALRVLAVLIALLGNNVTGTAPQIMTVLNEALKDTSCTQLLLQGLECWRMYVHSLAKAAPHRLERVVLQAAVVLLPMLDVGGEVAQAAAAVYEEMVVKQKRLVPRAIQRMPPLPTSPALEQVNTIIFDMQKGQVPGQRLKLLTHSLRHESINVRHAALGELQVNLGHKKQMADLLNNAILASANGHGSNVARSSAQNVELLADLQSALLRCSEHAMDALGKSMKERCAECLGLLSAIDPSRVKVVMPPPEGISSGEARFLVKVVTGHLVRIMETTNNITTLEFTTYAIQTLLQRYEKVQLTLSPSNDTSSRGNKSETVTGLMTLLPEEVQVIVQPYLTSNYVVEERSTKQQSDVPLDQTLFSHRATKGWPYRWWLYRWLGRMIKCTKGPLQPAFDGCSLVLKWDLPFMMFMLPYVVQNVVSQGSDEDTKAMEGEIIEVMRAAATMDTGQPVPEIELYVQTMFTLLDVLSRWVSEHSSGGTVASETPSSRSGGSSPTNKDSTLDAGVKRVAEMLEKVPKELLAQAAFKVGAHARALQYFETHVRALRGGGMNPSAKQTTVEYTHQEVSFLLEVYGQQEEPDGLSGLIQLRQGGLTISDQILAAEKAGVWSEALALYEQALEQERSSVPEGPLVGGAEGAGSGSLGSVQQGYLRCLLHMGHLQAVLCQVDGLMARCDTGVSARLELASAGVAAAWRAGAWELLEEYLEIIDQLSQGSPLTLPPQHQWEVRVGSLLKAVKEHDKQGVSKWLRYARQEIMTILPAVSMESYARAYPHVLKLHMLHELQEVHEMLESSPQLPAAERIKRLKWEQRLQAVAPTLSCQEPLLALRRQLADVMQDRAGVGHCWLQLAKLCRATGHHDSAATAALEAEVRQVPGAILERAKLLWDVDRHHRAIMQLQHAVKQFGEDSKLDPSQRNSKAHLVLQLAWWMADTGQGIREELVGLFEQAIELSPKWDKAFFQYARYLDELYQDAKKRQKEKPKQDKNDAGKGSAADRLVGRSRIPLGEDQPYLDYLPQVLQNYGRSIESGRKHILQALPRLLTLYFEFGSDQDTRQRSRQAMSSRERSAATTAFSVMHGLTSSISTAAWLTVLPQLISRICHPHEQVQEQVHKLLLRITKAFPHQALWAMAAVHKSTVQSRKDAAAKIIKKAREDARKEGGRHHLYDQFNKLCEHLIRLCSWTPPSQQRRDYQKYVSAKQTFSSLVSMLPVDVMIPTQAALTCALPHTAHESKSSTITSAQQFPTITSMKDEVQIMPSLQKPKKITFVGSDGNEYSFLAKPKDDLRKDYRLMDFAGVLNNMLAREAKSRRRNLHLRTYAVLPLTEDAGILQWVNNLTTLKACCEDVYTKEGLYNRRSTPALIRKMYDGYRGTRRSELLDQVLTGMPPRLHKWWLGKFPEPAGWLAARLSFTRTNAAWCMVGHMLGLGDRHGENMLIDSTNGDTIHVDFGCLFDKGLTLEVPEMVPFRLTQNIVDCFGVSGVEGTFRKSSEITLQVLREHRETLMICAETFLHDPFVEWTKIHSGAEVENPHAKDALVTMEGRVTGTLVGVSSLPTLPLSCEGHAHRLIREAVDKENLGRMYIWWMPWF